MPADLQQHGGEGRTLRQWRRRRVRAPPGGPAVGSTAWPSGRGRRHWISNFGSYSATYGSLGSVVVILLYFFLSSAMVLLGAEVNAAILHAAERQPSGSEEGSSGKE